MLTVTVGLVWPAALVDASATHPGERAGSTTDLRFAGSGIASDTRWAPHTIVPNPHEDCARLRRHDTNHPQEPARPGTIMAESASLVIN